MVTKGKKRNLVSRVYSTDFTYESYEGKTETVSIPLGDFATLSAIFTEEEMAVMLNSRIRTDFVNYSNRKPSTKVDAVKVLLARMTEQCVGKTDAEKSAWLYEQATGSRIQAPAGVEENEGEAGAYTEQDDEDEEVGAGFEEE